MKVLENRHSVPNGLTDRARRAYLGIDCEVWIPRVWRNDLADAKLSCLRCDFAHVFHGVLPLLLCRLVDGGLLELVHATCLLQRLFDGGGLASAFNGRQVQRQAHHAAQRLLGMYRAAVLGSGEVLRLGDRGAGWGGAHSG